MAKNEGDTNEQPKPSVARNLTRAAATRIGMLGMLTTGTVLGAACSNVPTVLTPQRAQAAGVTDFDILNFALNLEYLEAEFYYYATTGAGITAAGIGTSGTGSTGATTGGKKTAFTNNITQSVAQQITTDEGTHVTLLRGALGNQAVAKPAIDLSAGGKFDFTTMTAFLQLSRAFEDTGVSAYTGAAPLISSKEILQTAAQILGMEVYHASNVRLMIAQMGIATTATDSQDVLPPPTGTDFFCDVNALTIVRNTTQVLAIVNPFFPNGLNGTIR